MNEEADIEEIDYAALRDHIKAGYSIAIFSDGGSRRERSLASFAWLIYVVYFHEGQWEYVLCAKTGTLLRGVHCSFLVEALALEGAFRFITKHI